MLENHYDPILRTAFNTSTVRFRPPWAARLLLYIVVFQHLNGTIQTLEGIYDE